MLKIGGKRREEERRSAPLPSLLCLTGVLLSPGRRGEGASIAVRQPILYRPRWILPLSVSREDFNGGESRRIGSRPQAPGGVAASRPPDVSAWLADGRSSSSGHVWAALVFLTNTCRHTETSTILCRCRERRVRCPSPFSSRSTSWRSPPGLSNQSFVRLGRPSTSRWGICARLCQRYYLLDNESFTFTDP